MTDFAAIDFETANECPSSVCSVGVVIVRDGQIVDSFYSLIHPEPEYYKWFCQQVHGLTEEDTEDAPVFPYVWEKIAPKIEGLPLVAHNSRFDEGCLKAAFRVYRMDYPEYEFHDTLSASRKHFGCGLPNHQLQTVAAACGYDLTRHHHALADAEASAHIAIKLLRQPIFSERRSAQVLSDSDLVPNKTFIRYKAANRKRLVSQKRFNWYQAKSHSWNWRETKRGLQNMTG